jgi:hypothetical protein
VADSSAARTDQSCQFPPDQTDEEVLMKNVGLTLLVGAALAIGVSGNASADPLGSSGCFGQFVSGFAQTGALGGVLSAKATNPNSVPYGQTTVPKFKTVACGA